jgi:regulator of protease activity HflC (stomatin/prohibitin superfamily)
MKNTIKIASAVLLAILITNSRTIRQGDVGVKRTLGKIDSKPLQPGPRAFNPFVSTIILVPVRTVNLEVNLALPSKEGLNVDAEISILYHVEPNMATQVISDIGKDYQESVILPVFRAAAADVTANYMAKDMHTGNRAEIEEEVRKKMMSLLEERGFVIEAVLMKSIKLPEGLYRAIEEKLEAEQQAQRMEFVIQQEKQEAERRTIEAAGIRDANKIISEGLTPQIIQYKAIEAYRELAKSPNAKVIIGSGSEAMIINPE